MSEHGHMHATHRAFERCCCQSALLGAGTVLWSHWFRLICIQPGWPCPFCSKSRCLRTSHPAGRVAASAQWQLLLLVWRYLDHYRHWLSLCAELYRALRVVSPTHPNVGTVLNLKYDYRHAASRCGSTSSASVPGAVDPRPNPGRHRPNCHGPERGRRQRWWRRRRRRRRLVGRACRRRHRRSGCVACLGIGGVLPASAQAQAQRGRGWNKGGGGECPRGNRQANGDTRGDW